MIENIICSGRVRNKGTFFSSIYVVDSIWTYSSHISIFHNAEDILYSLVSVFFNKGYSTETETRISVAEGEYNSIFIYTNRFNVAEMSRDSELWDIYWKFGLWCGHFRRDSSYILSALSCCIYGSLWSEIL